MIIGKLWNQGSGQGSQTHSGFPGWRSQPGPGCLPSPHQPLMSSAGWAAGLSLFSGRTSHQAGLELPPQPARASTWVWVTLSAALGRAGWHLVLFGRQAPEGGGSLVLGFPMKPWGRSVVGFTCRAVSAEWSLDTRDHARARWPMDAAVRVVPLRGSHTA